MGTTTDVIIIAPILVQQPSCTWHWRLLAYYLELQGLMINKNASNTPIGGKYGIEGEEIELTYCRGIEIRPEY